MFNLTYSVLSLYKFWQMSDLLVYKFGGASVKDADGVKNLCKIIDESGSKNNLIVVISAMGKSTNALEVISQKAHKGENCDQELNDFIEYHNSIIDGLFADSNEIRSEINELIDLLKVILEQANRMSYDYAYDQIVSFGELMSTKIVTAHLISQNIESQWIDARKCILTDSTHRNAEVNLNYTSIFSKKNFSEFLDNKIIITQGFIGSNSDGNTTTLGREGSDYSAAIFATSLDAHNVTIWKDVDGILNADPKKLKSTVKYDNLAYEEVIEMSYYGATVIHPKTLKPLANKNISLHVKSFVNPNKEGTTIGLENQKNLSPAIITKENQALISFRKKDLSFMEEENIGKLTEEISSVNMKINLIQKSALNYSVVTDFEEEKINSLYEKVSGDFIMQYNTELQLVTIKNYKTLEIPKEINCSEILLEQKTRKNIQYLVK